MQTHQDIWFSVSDQLEHVYFRAFHQPTPVLDFITWPIRVSGVVFPDVSEITSASEGGTGAAGVPGSVQINVGGNFGASPGLTFDTNTQALSVGGCIFLGGVEFACPNGAGGIDLFNIDNINGGSATGPGQTPWLSNINANNWQLQNLLGLSGAFQTGLGNAAPGINFSGNNINISGGSGTGAGGISIVAGSGAVSISSGTSIVSIGASSTLTLTGNPVVAGVPFGIGTSAPQFALDVNGVTNTSLCYYIAGVEFACGNGAGGIDLTNISTVNGSAYPPSGGGGVPTGV